MGEWKSAVQYFKNERVLIKMILDFEYMKEVAESNFGEDTIHAKIITDFVNYSDIHKREYLEYVFNSCNIC